jgi:PBSX family phage portal protein
MATASELADETREHLERRRPVVKAEAVGVDSVGAPSSRSDDQHETGGVFKGQNLLKPPYDPEWALRMWENSTALPQNVAAYETNIDGLGHRLQPRIDFKAKEATEKVRDALWLKRVRDAEVSQRANQDEESEEPLPPIDLAALLPSDEEVEEAVKKLELQARLEWLKLDSFFEFVNPNGSFVELRRDKRQEQEITGNAYWEVLRDKTGKIARFVSVPPTHVRCTAQDQDPVQVEELVLIGLEYENVTQHKFFRRFAQRHGQKLTWFKEYGDPRVVSRETGQVYQDMAAFEAAKSKSRNKPDQPATEMIHFRIQRPGEAYGVPRWIGAMLSVMGSRATDEVNYNYFDNKGIPPLALLVSGGRIDDESVDRIKDYIRDHIKGRENFHKILVIQADEDPMGGEHPKLTFEKLTDAQQGDALFQKYDERNIDKVGGTFRLPRLVRGESKDFNRATAQAVLQFVDEQVFDPERREFDAWVNRVIFPALGVTLWRFKSKGPQTRDPEKVAEIIVNLVKVGVLTPNEARELGSDILGLELDYLEAAWAKQPLQLTLAGFPPEGGENNDEELSEMERLARDAANNSQRRQRLEEAMAEADAAAARHGEDLLGGDQDGGDEEAAA